MLKWLFQMSVSFVVAVGGMSLILFLIYKVCNYVDQEAHANIAPKTKMRSKVRQRPQLSQPKRQQSTMPNNVVQLHRKASLSQLSPREQYEQRHRSNFE